MNAHEVIAELSSMGVVVAATQAGEMRLRAKVKEIPVAAVQFAKQHRDELQSLFITDEKPVGFVCPWCRSIDLIDDDAGLRCGVCDQLAWLDLPDGGRARADQIGGEFEEVDLDDVPVCRSCGHYCDTETLASDWRCSKCNPEADTRRRRTRLLLRLHDRLVEQQLPCGRN